MTDPLESPASVSMRRTLHALRSTMARVQAEAELLALDGVAVGGMLDGLSAAFSHLDELDGTITESDQNPSMSQPTRLAVCVIDDDVRLGELTAARLSRRGIVSSYQTDLRIDSRVGAQTVLVIDLGVLVKATPRDRGALANRSFVVVSGAASVDARSTALGAGAAAFLLKPVPIGRLIEAITRALENSA